MTRLVENPFTEVTEDVERHWQKVTQEWPEPLLAWSGQLEEVESEFVIGDHPFTSKISLWLRRQEDPTDRASWGGGFLVPSITDRMQMVLEPRTEPVRLSIPGRKPGRIWFSGSSAAGQILFVGTGPYPHRIGSAPAAAPD